MRVHVQGNCHDVAVAGALAISEQAAFNAVPTGHQAQFAGGDAGAAVVMGVEADHHLVTVWDRAPEQLNLVGVDIGGGAFDRGRQVEDDRVFDRRLEHVHHRGTNLYREIDLCCGEGFGAVFELPVGAVVLGGLVTHDFGALDRDLLDLVAAHAEDDPAPGR